MNFKIDEEFRQANRKHTKQERLNLEVLIEGEGCQADALTVGIIGTDRFLIDGHSTVDICKEKGIKLTEPRCLVFKDREAILDWIHRRQRGRRNLSPEAMAKNRESRIERVAQASANGQSTRQIAEDEGVSQKTIVQDLKDAKSDTPVSPDGHAKNTAKSDEKKIDSKQGAEEVRCTACKTKKRKGQELPRSCSDCKLLRDAAKKPAPKFEVADEEEESEPTIDDEIKAKNHEIESFCRKLMKLVDDECPKDVWLDDLGRRDGAIQKFKDGCATLRGGKCHGPCPACNGDGCGKCKKSGRVTKLQHDQMS